MHILNILNEGKFSKSEYAYHATKKEHIQSILKHGLIPNKSEGGYGSDETSEGGYSLNPLHGVYFTKSAKDAIFIGNSMDKTPIIIVAKIQQNGTATLDEDRLVEKIIDEKAFRRFVLNNISSFHDFDSYDDYQDAYYGEIENIIKEYIADSKAINTALDVIKDTSAQNAIRQELTAYLHAVADIAAQMETNESTLKLHQSNLTKMLRNVMRKSNSADDFKTFKVDGPVGFRGANRIVGMYNVNTRIGWGDIGALSGYALHVASTPQRMLRDD